MRPQEYAKAIAGGILAGLGALYLGLSDNVVTAQEWVGVAQTSLAAFAVVWGVPNAAKKELVSQQTVTVETKTVDAPKVSDKTLAQLADTNPDGPDHRADEAPRESNER